MSILLLGGTGTVGGALAGELARRGRRIRVLTRSREKATNLPEGAEAVFGDLGDPTTYPKIFEGAESVFLLNAVSPTELQEGLAAVNETRRAGARRLVYLSVQNADRGPHIPHFAGKIVIEQAIRESGIPYTILRPNNFYQNDLFFKDALVQYGVYAQPLGKVGVSRVDVRDIAELAALALTEEGHAGKTYTVAGPRAWTGGATAEAWSEALGKKISYAGDDLDAWEKQALQMLPAWMVYDFKLMYRMFQDKGLRASDSEIKDLEAALGHPPRRFEDFAMETASAWR